MIKAVALYEDGRKLVILGLSRINTEKLLTDKPIMIDLEADLHLPGAPRLIIMGGETEADILTQLNEKGLIDAETPIGHGYADQ